MRDAQLKELLALSTWDHLTPAEQEEAALSSAARLSESFRFAGLASYELGQQRHRVAFFTWKEARFALIPGGPATLGYAPGSFLPTEAQEQSWRETCREYPEIALKYPTLESYLEPRLTPLRQVTFQPFLLETVAKEITVHRKQSYQDYSSLTIPFSHGQIQEALAQDGFRFPASDEWEYACAAGARTLWRWGDETPMISMSSRRNPAEWDLHLRPNAFGLLIGDYPATWEFTAEEWVLRGGDGGTTLSVGPGRFVEWLLLASSYIIKLRPRASMFRVSIRRAYSVFQ